MRKCIFCGGRSGSREHVFPAWILQKVKSAKFACFIGHHKNLSFDEWITKMVCHGCNTGWMGRMETAICRTLGPMIDDHSILLDAPQQWAIAAWSVKTAMTMHSTIHSARPMFYTPEEHRALMVSSSIPSRTTVFLGRYLGSPNLGGVAVDFTVREIDRVSECPVRASTFLFGHLVVQVVTVHATPEYSDRTILIGCTQGPWDDSLVVCWPTKGRKLYWPPALAFHEGIEKIEFLVLADRYMIGREVPL